MSGANLILLAGAAFVGSLLAAVAGFGGAAILLPLLVAAFGVREAIPILTVAQLLGNLSRAWFNRRELDLPVVGWFALTGVPAALLGGFLFASAPLSFLTRPRHFSDRRGGLPPRQQRQHNAPPAARVCHRGRRI
ncbi:MAG TPA: sulfite exporter TauE/SafE family protein [Candidatus Binatia bacterium]